MTENELELLKKKFKRICFNAQRRGYRVNEETESSFWEDVKDYEESGERDILSVKWKLKARKLGNVKYALFSLVYPSIEEDEKDIPKQRKQFKAKIKKDIPIQDKEKVTKERKKGIYFKLDPKLLTKLDVYTQTHNVKKVSVVEKALKDYLDRTE